MSKKEYLTREQLEEKKRELERIENILKPKNAKDLEEAIAQGDLSENAEYDAAKNEQALLDKREKELRNLIRNAIVIDEKKEYDKVEVGSRVKIMWLHNNHAEEIRILGRGNGFDTISADSKLGEALLEKKEGEVCTIYAPRGIMKVRILEIY